MRVVEEKLSDVECVAVDGVHLKFTMLCRSSSPGVESHPDYDRSRSADRGKGQLCSFKNHQKSLSLGASIVRLWLEIFKHFADFVKSKLTRLSSTCSKNRNKEEQNRSVRRLCSGSSAPEQEACAFLSTCIL